MEKPKQMRARGIYKVSVPVIFVCVSKDRGAAEKLWISICLKQCLCCYLIYLTVWKQQQQQKPQYFIGWCHAWQWIHSESLHVEYLQRLRLVLIAVCGHHNNLFTCVINKLPHIQPNSITYYTEILRKQTGSYFCITTFLLGNEWNLNRV